MSILTRRRLIGIFAAIVLGVAIGIGGRALLVGGSSSIFGEIKIGGPFSLTDQDGRRRTDGEFRGRLMLITFGYTFCPDVCPLDLQLMSDAIDALCADGDKVQPLFVTVDPGRDTPAVLKSYVEHFSPRIVALTGTPAETDAAARGYKVYYKVNGDPARDPNYLVDHSAFIYLMGGDGRLLAYFTHETPPDKLAAAIRARL
ncbi:MAG: SCO family protein [Proteobacteria bacterium]|nr:SCO family protein [Pseudomonadota bacterium]